MPSANSSKSAITLLARQFDETDVPIYLLDGERRIIYCNRACCDWLGLGSENIVGQTCVYHTSSGTPINAGERLCPPPDAFQGKRISIEISPAPERQPRFVDFLPLEDSAGQSHAILAVARPSGGGRESASWSVSGANDAPVAIHNWLANFHRQYASAPPICLIGKTAEIRLARTRFELAGKAAANVLVVGPAGSGRDEVARALQASGGMDAPAAIVDCGSMSEGLLHAATTAHDHRGRAPAMLVLRDIDRLQPAWQIELFRLISSRNLAGRLISTASSDLREAVQRGDFRADLKATLSPIVIELPPLAACPDDLPLLAQALLELQNANGGKQLGGFSADALDLMFLYSWPGNVAELREVVKYAYERAESALITAADLPDHFGHVAGAWSRPRVEEQSIMLDQVLAEIELDLIERALATAKGNKTRAAELLGLNRPRFYRRLLQLGLVKGEDDEGASE